MLFMVIEHFKNGDARPIYRRLRDEGRGIPAGISYVGSWVEPDLKRCFQVMDCPDRATLDTWIAQWSDLVDFEVLPVLTSAEAQAKIAPLL